MSTCQNKHHKKFITISKPYSVKLRIFRSNFSYFYLKEYYSKNANLSLDQRIEPRASTVYLTAPQPIVVPIHQILVSGPHIAYVPLNSSD